MLCFGESFDISFENPKGEILFVASSPGIVIHSGRQSRRQEVCLEDLPSPYSAWKVESLNVMDKDGQIGKPVEVKFYFNILKLQCSYIYKHIFYIYCMRFYF